MQDLLRVHLHAGEPCPRCRTTIRKTRVAQRGTYWCPRCQDGADAVVSAIEGVRVGHWTDAEAGTGCTVILPAARQRRRRGGARGRPGHPRDRAARPALGRLGGHRAAVHGRERLRARRRLGGGALVRGAGPRARDRHRPRADRARRGDLRPGHHGQRPPSRRRTRATPPARPRPPGPHPVGSVGAGTGSDGRQAARPGRLVQGRARRGSAHAPRRRRRGGPRGGQRLGRRPRRGGWRAGGGLRRGARLRWSPPSASSTRRRSTPASPRPRPRPSSAS